MMIGTFVPRVVMTQLPMKQCLTAANVQGGFVRTPRLFIKETRTQHTMSCGQLVFTSEQHIAATTRIKKSTISAKLAISFVALTVFLGSIMDMMLSPKTKPGRFFLKVSSQLLVTQGRLKIL